LCDFSKAVDICRFLSFYLLEAAKGFQAEDLFNDFSEKARGSEAGDKEGLPLLK
jgi:hypothetical protein